MSPIRKSPYQKMWWCSSAFTRKLKFCFVDQWDVAFFWFMLWWSISESRNDSSRQIVYLIFKGLKYSAPLTLSVHCAICQNAVLFRCNLFMKTTLVTGYYFLMKNIWCCCSSEIVDWVPTLDGLVTRAIWRQESCWKWQRNLVGALL